MPNETLLAWAFAGAVAVHNLEEALWLPAWSRRVEDRWRRPVADGAFRFAVCMLTAFAAALVVLATATHATIWWHLVAAYALGQALNVVFPHLIVTIATRSYAPGLGTGVALVLPSAIAFLERGFAAGLLRLDAFLVTTALFVPATVAAIPALLWIGRRLTA
ncbi:HXXEE domain-containing protein [Salinarimonas rosea]|uniref:HXXEE domain-containing protein n=1 Tax=Salinarimonas rosea TaxID=552063 RepID=UPI00069456B9|nr:HXXEE domain-containing protein [Salinarimonas rosea]